MEDKDMSQNLGLTKLTKLQRHYQLLREEYIEFEN